MDNDNKDALIHNPSRGQGRKVRAASLMLTIRPRDA
jgi:hypothetical protein